MGSEKLRRSQAKEKGDATGDTGGVTGAARWCRMGVSRVVVVKSR
jgi:hypothetical protein